MEGVSYVSICYIFIPFGFLFWAFWAKFVQSEFDQFSTPPRDLFIDWSLCIFHSFRFFVIVRDQLNDRRLTGGDPVKALIHDPEKRPVRHSLQDLQVQNNLFFIKIYIFFF
jgi:hypothetical protein